jgi:hypothetical protein
MSANSDFSSIYPTTISPELSTLCQAVATPEKALDKLESNIPCYLAFFKAAMNDPVWMDQNPALVTRMKNFLNNPSDMKEKKSLSQDPKIQKTMKSSSSILGQNSLTHDDITITFSNELDANREPKKLKINSLLLKASGSGFDTLITREDRKLFDVTLFSHGLFSVLKEFLETGNITQNWDTINGETELLPLLEVCECFDLTDFLQYIFSKINFSNYDKFFSIGLRLNRPKIVQRALSFINGSAKGMSLETTDNDQFTFNIFNCSAENFKKMEPLLISLQEVAPRRFNFILGSQACLDLESLQQLFTACSTQNNESLNLKYLPLKLEASQIDELLSKILPLIGKKLKEINL